MYACIDVSSLSFDGDIVSVFIVVGSHGNLKELSLCSVVDLLVSADSIISTDID